MTNDTLGKNIARFREQAGLSQSEVGRRLSVASQAVARWEHGGWPDTALLPRIAMELGCSLDALFSLAVTSCDHVEDILTQELQRTSPEQRLEQTIRYAWHMMKMNGALADNSVDSFYTVASSCEDADQAPGSGARSSTTNCSFTFDGGLMQASVASRFKYVLMMQEPQAGFGSILKDIGSYQKLFALFSKAHRLEVFLLGFSLPQGRLFTRDYVCEQLLISPQLAQEILDELCDHRMLGYHSIQVSGNCTEAYVCHEIPIFIPFLYFAGAIMREGKTYYMSAAFRSGPLLKEPVTAASEASPWEPISSKERPSHLAYTLASKGK